MLGSHSTRWSLGYRPILNCFISIKKSRDYQKNNQDYETQQEEKSEDNVDHINVLV